MPTPKLTKPPTNKAGDPHRSTNAAKVTHAASVTTSATTAAGASFSFPDIIAAQPTPTNARERILFAAVEILNAEGFGALTQTKVAERAGVRQSHITYYFPMRNDLLRETAVYGCNAMLEAMSGDIDAGLLTLTNVRNFLTTDIHDRRFARLMCALIVASDEDDRIKPWLASFEETNRDRLLHSFQRLGLRITTRDIEVFHATYIGALLLDLGESTEESMIRTRHTVNHAFDLMMAAAEKKPQQVAAKIALSKASSKRKRPI